MLGTMGFIRLSARFQVANDLTLSLKHDNALEFRPSYIPWGDNTSWPALKPADSGRVVTPFTG